jgi:hypothetical protein
MSEDKRKDIVEILTHKAAMKQDIADNSEIIFSLLKDVLNEELEHLKKNVDDDRVRLSCKSVSDHEFRVFIGSDVVVFQLHRNIFRLPDQHALWETDYLKNNEANGYFGVINMYNFLAESFEQRRMNDVGYLIGRIFMNHDNRCLVEGKAPGFSIYENLSDTVLDKELIRGISQAALAFAIDFDLITPPYEMIQELSFGEIEEISTKLQVATGKRLGFKFSADDNTVF